MYGHGSANCFRAEACLGCGGAHDYSNCQLNKTTEDGPVIYKCFNCMKKKLKNANHRADDPHCPSRREYLQIRQRTTNSRRSVRQIPHGDIVSISSDEIRAEASGYEKLFPQKLSGKRQNNVSYASVAGSNQRTQQDDSLTNEQILDIYFEALDALEKCKTKYDKMRVLGNMLKYVI